MTDEAVTLRLVNVWTVLIILLETSVRGVRIGGLGMPLKGKTVKVVIIFQLDKHIKHLNVFILYEKVYLLYILNFSECRCNRLGTARCDYRNGFCLCKPNVIGTLCDECGVSTVN